MSLLEKVVSCLGLQEETITLFEWKKISIALFACLGLIEVNYKETPIIGAADQETIVHKISGTDDIPHTIRAQFASHTKPMAFLQLSTLK